MGGHPVKANEMHRFSSILCVIEQGKDNRPALDRAVALAENDQARLAVATVIPRVSTVRPFAESIQAAMVREREALMGSLVEPHRQGLDIEQRILIGTSFIEVIREVLRSEHDLVIKCPEAPSWLGRLFAGDDMHLLRKCPCPVLLVKPSSPRSYDVILAAVDVDDLYPPRELNTRYLLNSRILELAAALALAESADLHVVHAWTSMAELADGLVFSSDVSRVEMASSVGHEQLQQQHLLEQLVRDTKIRSRAPRDANNSVRLRTHLLKGAARREIPALAKRLGADCIVMGTVGRTGVRGLIMGNTAETILEQIDCAVLAIKPQGFATPVALDE